MADPLIKIVASDKVVEIKASIGKMMFANFLSGMAWGLGTVVGATVIVTLLIFIVGQLNTAPLIGGYISNILNNIPSTPPTR